MSKTKKELENELSKIGKKLNALIKDFAGIKENIKTVQKHSLIKRDNKKIADLKNKIASL
jgi:peptidoglycan hydrolase CwlO-like protein